MQLTLFDTDPIARRSDPLTSHIAAANVEAKLTGRRLQFVEALRSIGRAATANEIAATVDHSGRESVRKRAAECVRLGFVSECGTKTCSVTGNVATVYCGMGQKEDTMKIRKPVSLCVGCVTEFHRMAIRVFVVSWTVANG